MRHGIMFIAGLAFAATVSAQARLPVIVPLRGPAPPQLQSVDALRADFIARSGSDQVYFAGGSAVLSVPARTTLAAQAQWLRQNPQVLVRIEGHAELSDTRAHALAIGARRAQEVRGYLVLMGVPAAQVTATSWGKERPGPARAQTVLVR